MTAREYLTKAGTIRTSQLLWNYGPGALIDLPNWSAITMGLHHRIAQGVDGWDMAYAEPIEEPRLLHAVRRRLGRQVESLRMPPFKADNDGKTRDQIPIGAPVEPFPRWVRCTRCSLLAPMDDPAIRLKPGNEKGNEIRFEHHDCYNGWPSDAIPARLVLACRNGHLDEFPWHWYAHRGQSSCEGILRLYSVGSAIESANLMVECSCGTKRPLAHAVMGNDTTTLPACRGHHPHLSSFEPCTQSPTVLSLGSSNLWFPVTLSTLDIPLPDDAPEQPLSQHELKWPEWQVLTGDVPGDTWPQFRLVPTNVPKDLTVVIDQVARIERLREVNTLIGFTRVDAPDEDLHTMQANDLVTLTRGNPTWVPAGEVYGEGLFIRFRESAIQDWERAVSVQQRFDTLYRGHQQWRTARNLAPGLGMPDMRYVMIHTFAHVLIRELALECGYSAASIKERIYASSDEAEPMAGVLVYTAANDTDGTLGGLVELGTPARLSRIIQNALQRAYVCSSDPLCAEHLPDGDGTVHLAACHACTFLAETSCERGNKYLDRSVLVPTFDGLAQVAFFPDQTARPPSTGQYR
ncbi:DUF1998 domain-containing protein [Stomatohabitans albus]|uniref:DUF1998 domain-containing protein n=1 Tax=Stomatohabitans albus TaxID=3110766 RepID=UPI00300C1A15